MANNNLHSGKSNKSTNKHAIAQRNWETDVCTGCVLSLNELMIYMFKHTHALYSLFFQILQRPCF